MPFIEQSKREKIKLLGVEASEEVGDLTYVFYDSMVKEWNKEPRWRTAHKLFKDYSEQPEATDYFHYVYDRVLHKFELEDVVCASKLAYHQFYYDFVLEYELNKMIENGPIN